MDQERIRAAIVLKVKTATNAAVETWFQRSCLMLSALSRYKRASVSTSQA